VRALLRKLLSWRVLSAASGLLVLAAIVGGLVLYGAGADQRGDNTEFNARDLPGRGPTLRANSQRNGAAAPTSPIWPAWGRSARRDRFLRSTTIRPPFGQQWTFGAHSLLEYPPSVGVDNLYVGANDGTIYALANASGKVVWKTRTPGPIASSPAIGGNFLYQTSMDGKLYVLDARTGDIAWTWHAGGSRIESSAIGVGRRVLFGTHDGKVYAINTRRHRPSWTFRADDAIKGGVAVVGDTVFAGTYGGRLYALNLKTGGKRWSTQTRREFAFAGSLYSTPSVAYGRVFVGSTDGRVYSLGARSGEIVWVSSTGDWVYGSPAVAHKLVFVGSYDHYFYAFDARTGERRWRFKADDRIAGSATVIGKTVYFSSMGGTTYGLNAVTGKPQWSFPDGRYSPIVSDGQRIFLTGRTHEYAFTPASDAVG
jgi:outer membrane protein assembly factor BamB